MLGSIELLRQRVASGNITRELDLQDGLQDIVDGAHDGHLGFATDFIRVLGWVRDNGCLYSMSADGISIPEIFAVDDVVAANAGRIDFVPSPITAIDDKGITEYLTSIDLGYQDPDASFNALLYQVSQGTEGLKSGLFCTPQRYPGPSTSYTFRNGTTAVHDNYAYANRDFSNVVNGSSFYAKFCNASNKGSADSGSGANRGRDISELDLEKRQTGGLKPFVQSSDKSFTGYLFIGAKNTELARTAVIVLNEFSFTDTSQIRGLLTQFLDSCREQAVDHLVLDLSSNPGGSIILAYEFMRAVSNSRSFSQLSADYRYSSSQQSRHISCAITVRNLNSTSLGATLPTPH